jgi:hypothetical protein
LRSPFARAVVPVLGGIAVLALIFGFLWLMAAWLSGDGTETSERLAPTRLELGSVTARADDVAREGPFLFQELDTVTGTRSIVVHHEGDDPAQGWRIYYAHPVDRPDCLVEQIPETRTFVDCDGDELDVTELSPPTEDVRPVVEDQKILFLDLSALGTAPDTES